MEQIRIDLVPGGVTPNAHASQYDVGRGIRFLLYNGGTAYTLAGTETITVKMAKPDGTEETVSVTNTSSNYVDFVTTDGLLDQAGLYPCEISIVNGTDVIGSKNFNLRVEMDPYNGKGLRVVTVGPADICTFEPTISEPLVKVKCELTPSLTGYSAVNLTACGVNLFDKTATIYEGYINDTNGNYSANANYKCTDYIPIKGGLDYYIISEQSGSNWGAWYDKDKNYIEGLNSYANKVKTAPANACYARLTIWASGSGNVDTFGFNYPSTDTSYHAYTGNAYAIALGNTYYGGTLDVTTGVLTVEYDSSLQPITPYDVQLTPTAVTARAGVNNVFADCGQTELKYLTIEV